MTEQAQNKSEYRKFCAEHQEMPIFLQDWWLDVVCQDGKWEVVLARDKGGNITGVLPYCLTRKLGFSIITMPMLTPYQGVWLNYPKGMEKEVSRHRFQNKTTKTLIDGLPKVAYYAQRHPRTLQNCLPFYWEGYLQTTRYTFALESIPPNLYESLKGSVRTEIAKAEGQLLPVVSSEDAAQFYRMNQKSFARQKEQIPYTLAFLQKLDRALSERQQRRIYFAVDATGKEHAAAYLVWDQSMVYLLMLGADTTLRASGAVKWLIWQGILLAKELGLGFDFEGGMMPNISPVFSAFGAPLQPYHKIYRGGNRLFRLLNSIRNL